MRVEKTVKSIIILNSLLIAGLFLADYYQHSRLWLIVICIAAVSISFFNIISIREMRIRTRGGFWYLFLEFIFLMVAVFFIFQLLAGFGLFESIKTRQIVSKAKTFLN